MKFEIFTPHRNEISGAGRNSPEGKPSASYGARKFETNLKSKIRNSKIEKLLPEIKKNIFLKNYTTFKIGGPAKYFFEAKSKKEIIKAILVAKKMKLPFFILGGGSNLLVADEGYNGLVIKVKSQKSTLRLRSGLMVSKAEPSKVKSTSQNSKVIEAESGALLNDLATLAHKNNLTGFGWAIGIPGTVGGAIYGNAGAFGKSMADVVKEVEVLDIKNLKTEKLKNLKTKKLKNKDCKFKYRDSIFTHKKNLIILSAIFKLKKGKKEEIEKKIKEYLNERKKTQPLNLPSAGSIFKNPSPAKISEKFRRTSNFSAGELIEKCGLKGKRIGNAKISEKHANFIVNLGKAKAKDVKKLINLAKQKVKKKFGILLEEEIQYL